jgi:hypothetical protein
MRGRRHHDRAEKGACEMAKHNVAELCHPSRVLYMRGLTWQRTRGSALLGWVGEDAAFITGQISAMPGREQPQ